MFTQFGRRRFVCSTGVFTVSRALLLLCAPAQLTNHLCTPQQETPDEQTGGPGGKLNVDDVAENRGRGRVRVWRKRHNQKLHYCAGNIKDVAKKDVMCGCITDTSEGRIQPDWPTRFLHARRIKYLGTVANRSDQKYGGVANNINNWASLRRMVLEVSAQTAL